MSAPPFGKRTVPIFIPLVIALVLFAALAFANYHFGSPLLRGNFRSLEYALPPSLLLVIGSTALVIGIGRVQEENHAEFMQRLIYMGILLIGCGLVALVFLEGLGNDLFSPPVGLTLAGLIFFLTMACAIGSWILSGKVRNVPFTENRQSYQQPGLRDEIAPPRQTARSSPQPKETRGEE